MDWNIENIESIVIFINDELKKNRTMTDIEKDEFNVNARVIHKRLIRLGYEKLENQYIKGENKPKKEHNQKTTKESIKEVHENTNSSTKEVLKDIDTNKLKELLELIEPIKELLEKEKNSNTERTTYKTTAIGLDIPIIKEVKQRTIKVDSNILKDWDNFVKENLNYKAQDLISQALKEFMDNHKK